MRRLPRRPARRACVVGAAVACARCSAPAGRGRGRCGGWRIASRQAYRHEAIARIDGANAGRARGPTRTMTMRTEQIDPRYIELDTWSVTEMLAAMYEGQV